jgi:hypothetical protein
MMMTMDGRVVEGGRERGRKKEGPLHCLMDRREATGASRTGHLPMAASQPSGISRLFRNIPPTSINSAPHSTAQHSSAQRDIILATSALECKDWYNSKLSIDVGTSTAE